MESLNKGLELDSLTFYFQRLFSNPNTIANLAMAKNRYFILVQREIKLLHFVQCFD